MVANLLAVDPESEPSKVAFFASVASADAALILPIVINSSALTPSKKV
jgi:hypothetical protein